MLKIQIHSIIQSDFVILKTFFPSEFMYVCPYVFLDPVYFNVFLDFFVFRTCLYTLFMCLYTTKLEVWQLIDYTFQTSFQSLQNLSIDKKLISTFGFPNTSSTIFSQATQNQAL